MTIRRYWFAMPMDLAEELSGEIPDYAGLVGVSLVGHNIEAATLRDAARLPCGKKATADEIYKVVKNLSMRYWNQFLNEGERQVEEVRSEA